MLPLTELLSVWAMIIARNQAHCQLSYTNIHAHHRTVPLKNKCVHSSCLCYCCCCNR
ncbi:hypothetical protein PF005_g29132 [Phytophthora fragariae]|uniref:Uncharacterized protein n=1 Tax=Phytophthora fragariae TaxID=53985 RepID=A0A6A3QB82_9STRA|nr:hypothetical protein PF003_g34912 [Phytophthora fragariae]KAE8919771.1 hypothetical protein PF009_g29927 [Phytophthora fragariae]KAE8963945.1 hypothetical protein PF011_g28849 [Phytophthora fragariae]KAE9065028.1 hypothetical protein PF007_g28984 [Phytophthora fragariae]KAE9072805.1 hypothetical protein PF006_g28854 [Phytophthora fragariae]